MKIGDIMPLCWFYLTLSKLCYEGLVKLIKRVKIAHLFLQCAKSVPCYHFKLVYVILQMAVKEFFDTNF